MTSNRAGGRTRARYFAAINSGAGFVSYFDENLRDRGINTCFIIKGGPGTGKSRLLGELGAAAEAAEAETEYYYCSSDPDSLDGVFARFPDGGCISALDGTSPHAAESRLPGACDQITDLGAFWDVHMLHARRDDIERLGELKAAASARAYMCLGAAASLKKAAESVILPCVDRAALRHAAESIVDSIPPSVRVSRRRPPIRSPLTSRGMRGSVAFDTFRERAGRVINIADRGGTCCEYLLIGEVLHILSGADRISPDYLIPARTDGVLVGDAAILPLNSLADVSKAIDIGDFIDRHNYAICRDTYLTLLAAADNALALADVAFRDMAEHHFALEKIYSDAMDFTLKEQFSRRLCAEFISGDLHHS